MNPFQQERYDYIKAHSTAEKQILPICRKYLAKSIAPIITHSETFGIDSLDPNLINGNIWNEFYQDVFQLIGMKYAKREFYHQRTLDTLEDQKNSAIDFLIDIWTSKFRDYALTYSFNIQRELNDTTIEIIRRALGETYQLGLDRDGSIRLFIKTLKERMSQRSKTISRTEATTISNLGKDIGARSWIEQTGGGGHKVWLGRNDEKERAAHLAENDTVIGLDELFDLNGELCERPGDTQLSPSERINCRCTISMMSDIRYNAYQKRGLIVDGKIIGAS